MKTFMATEDHDIYFVSSEKQHLRGHSVCYHHARALTNLVWTLRKKYHLLNRQPLEEPWISLFKVLNLHSQ